MFTLDTKYNNTVKIYAETIENDAISQIIQMANSPVGINAHIRIMPDVHAGKGCVIGTTMHIEDKICPNLVGVDIGCGVAAAHISQKLTEDNYVGLNTVCNFYVVSGRNVHEFQTKERYETSEGIINMMRCKPFLKELDYLHRSLGTLGGGNHFIELNKAEDGTHWLMVHSGSRNLGVQVAKHYQKIAEKVLKQDYMEMRANIINECHKNGTPEKISKRLEMVQKPPVTGLEYLEGNDMSDYLWDMHLCQTWAQKNREAIIDDILRECNWKTDECIETIHNYIDVDNKILRKGAIAAYEGQKCVIPLNMRDGSLICVGKGNEDWNFSAPHGAGRLMSRSLAKAVLDMEDFYTAMEGIVSSTVCAGTIDESPMAYKDYDEIMYAITPTVDIVERVIPVFNYKAVE